jgi:hypothetical protein
MLIFYDKNIKLIILKMNKKESDYKNNTKFRNKTLEIDVWGERPH